jgi:hypothetical protein
METINLGNIRGPAGAKGDKGDTGATGAKGDKGDTGATGAKGDKGDTGATGAKGDKGDTGAKGTDGLTFNYRGSAAWSTVAALSAPQIGWAYFLTVATGAPVPPSGTALINDVVVYTAAGWVNAGQMKGDKGDKGDAGANGVNGTNGLKGDKGDKGDAGTNGTNGLKGDKGDNGLKGDAGADGKDGASGVFLTTAAAQSISGVTLVNVTDLSAAVVAGKNYRITSSIIYQSASTGVGIALGVSAAAGALSARITIPTTATTWVDKITKTLAEKVISTGTPAANTATLAMIEGIYRCTTTGTLTIQAASETTASITIQGESFLFIEEL